MNINRFLAAMAIATVIGSPALAQSWDPDVGSGNIAPAPYGETDTGASIYEHDGRGFDAHAEAPRRSAKVYHSNKSRASNQVLDDNQVVGADPDINVRSELMRDNKETEF